MRRVALVTGVGRRAGIGAGIVARLAADGWDIGYSYWQPYDERMTWGTDDEAPELIQRQLADLGVRAHPVSADFTDVEAPGRVLDQVTEALGPVRALVMAHCESVDSGLLDTTVESFDRHFAVNARATWLLIKEFAARYRDPFGAGRIIALTSDHTVDNLPYGASKGALDRITIAAARELSQLGVTANVINPGPVNTGWMSPELVERLTAQTPLGRLGQPADCANLVAFLCSEQGGWINGQLLWSNGGL
ncbi:SDR family oxidoreductase [Rugosimonospora africana]|uniref:SDR family oxidoreductase n=1 Tax=Rugosimonospora africana TaxID=556532 RepID=UPI0019421264|nr:SDR family oxidoreductase [Rugosimonospora africana]